MSLDELWWFHASVNRRHHRKRGIGRDMLPHTPLLSLLIDVAVLFVAEKPNIGVDIACGGGILAHHMASGLDHVMSRSEVKAERGRQ